MQSAYDFRTYVVDALKRYWPTGQELVQALPFAVAPDCSSDSYPPQMQEIELPEWARDVGINGCLLVPTQCVTGKEGPFWPRTDWLQAVFWYLTGAAEPAFERCHGSIHSYSFRLKGWDTRIWDRAWVNRMALFLRRWAARQNNRDEGALFGPLPKAEIVLTHDVDAVNKTMAIRIKQTAFHSFNGVRSLVQGSFDKSYRKCVQAAHFFFSADNYWYFDRIMSLEEKCGCRSHFNFYGGCGGGKRSLRESLLDPSYNVAEPRIRSQLNRLRDGGWTIGLHQSFDSWGDSRSMRKERERVERAADVPVVTCRQHWLRFSWEKTWMAQQDAGLLLDTTLGFNDRPGFRNGASLRVNPWNVDREAPMKLGVLPMVLMDSHFYDYADLDQDQRITKMSYWVDEILSVGGEATIIWHQRVMGRDYGWASGYEALISIIGN